MRSLLPLTAQKIGVSVGDGTIVAWPLAVAHARIPFVRLEKPGSELARRERIE